MKISKTHLAVIVALICIISSLLYGFIVPRTEINIKTTFFESFAGPIVVNVKMKNVGTFQVNNLFLRIEVRDEDMEKVKINRVYNVSKLKPWYLSEERTFSMNFTGNQYHNYTIELYIMVNEHTYLFKHVARDYVMCNFQDKILEWG